MTAYTCKRLCCSVELFHRPPRPPDIEINGLRVTTSELAVKLDITHQAVRRRLDHESCMTRPRQPGNRIRRHRLVGMNLRSESDRLAAWFNRLPLVAA